MGSRRAGVQLPDLVRHLYSLTFLDTMASVYVDEAAGSDVTGDGSQQAPYQSLAYGPFTQG